MSRTNAPLYARLLGLRYVKPRPMTAFLLFEGSILVSVLLALAEIIGWWGVLVMPVAVAVMVKLNDAVAGALQRPLAIAALRTSQPVAVGWSAVSRVARPTTEIDPDDAVADPDARPRKTARGVAAVPGMRAEDGRPLRPPRPDVEVPHPGGADGRPRGNQGRFVS